MTLNILLERTALAARADEAVSDALRAADGAPAVQAALREAR